MSITFSTSTFCYLHIVSSNMNIMEWKLQQTIYKLEQWVDLNGFKFSQEKTKVIHFCRKRKLHPHQGCTSINTLFLWLKK